MPINPSRSSQGGDVEGQTPIFVSQGNPIMVSKASFDPGYADGSLDNVLAAGETATFTKADLVTGYCSYGKAIGE